MTEYFNRFVYEQRIRITAETFLIEANHRAKVAGKKAYVHVVGLGLGIWKLIDKQEVSNDINYDQSFSMNKYLYRHYTSTCLDLV